VKINGRSLEAVADPGSYLALHRVWHDGDTISVHLPMQLWTEPLAGDDSIQAALYGPWLALAADLGSVGSAAGLLLGVLAARMLAFIVYTATPRDPLVLAGVVLAMLLLGLLAVDPSSARTVDRSDDAAARGLNRPYCKSGCRMSQARLPYLYPKRP
jgi:TPR repeat protein